MRENKRDRLTENQRQMENEGGTSKKKEREGERGKKQRREKKREMRSMSD